MPDLFNFTDEMQDYFDTLPTFTQESLKQSNIKFNSLDDLKKCAKNLMENDIEV